MFGFNKDTNKIDRDKSIKMLNANIRGAILEQYGTDDPKIINRIWRTYMPEITNAILNTGEEIFNATKNQVNINENINIKHEELIAELKALREQNQESERRNKELQEKYNALVERMAGYIEKENGRGR